jgi:mevalonate pyrophosphate decarboxylase
VPSCRLPKFSEVTAEAHPVQGLICVHGYSDPEAHLMPVEGVFVALAAFPVTARIITSVGDSRLTAGAPSVSSNVPVRELDIARIQHFVHRAQLLLKTPSIREVQVSHDLGTGCGIGSSAAVFAAITKAMAALGSHNYDLASLARLSRLGSYSAAASFLGGLARILPSGDVLKVDIPVQWDLETVVFPVSPRSVATEKQSSRIHADVVTSPFYGVWQTIAADAARDAVAALAANDFSAFRDTIERYVLCNLGVIITGRDGDIPWEARTLEYFHWLRDLRDEDKADFGVSANSGPSVFVFASASVVDQLLAIIETEAPDIIEGGPERA